MCNKTRFAYSLLHIKVHFNVKIFIPYSGKFSDSNFFWKLLSTKYLRNKISENMSFQFKDCTTIILGNVLYIYMYTQRQTHSPERVSVFFDWLIAFPIRFSGPLFLDEHIEGSSFYNSSFT